MPPPPSKDPDAEIKLAVALQKFSMEIESLQRDIREVRELRDLATKLENILGQFEIRFDNLRERHEYACADLTALTKRFNVELEKLSDERTQRIKDAAERQEAIAKETLEKAKSDAATKKLVVGGIITMLTALVTSAGAIVIALITAYSKVSGG